MNEENRNLLNRGRSALNNFYEEEVYEPEEPDIQFERPELYIRPYVEEHPDYTDEYLKNLNYKDIMNMKHIRDEMDKYPHTSIEDIKRRIPGLSGNKISEYLEVLRNVNEEKLFGKPIEPDKPESRIILNAADDVLNKMILAHGKVLRWYDRLKNMIPSSSSVFDSIVNLVKNNGVGAAKTLLALGLVALGTYAAKKTYDYIFKGDKTIEDKELGLPKPEPVVIPNVNVPLAKIKHPEKIIDEIPKEEIIPEIKPKELKELEKIMEKPQNIMVDHSEYIHKKIYNRLSSNLRRNREWEPYGQYRY